MYISGEQISEDEAENRSVVYQKKQMGSFVYHSIKDTYGKSIW